MQFLDKISMGSQDCGAKGAGEAGKQNSVVGSSWPCILPGTGSWGSYQERQSEKAKGSVEHLGRREQETRTHGNLFSAGAEAQEDSCGEVVLG